MTELKQSFSSTNQRWDYQDMGAGPVVVLVHGSLCDYRYWHSQVRVLARKFRVICPCLPHFYPQLDNDYSNFTLEFHAQHILTLLEYLQIEQFNLVGHSRGGSIALKIALLNPTKPHLQRLVLADPGLRQDNALKPILTQANHLIKHNQTDAALELFIDTVSNAGTWKMMVSNFKQMVRDNAPTLLGQQHEAPFFPSSTELNELSQMQIPTLLIGGEKSPAPFPQALDYLAKHLPHNSRWTVQDASHGMNLLQPHAFNQALTDFFNAS